MRRQNSIREYLWALLLIVLSAGTVVALATGPMMNVAFADDDDGDGDDDDDDDDQDDDDDRPARRKASPRAELIAVGLSDSALASLSGRGFEVLTRSRSRLLGDRDVTRIRAPSGRSRAASLRDIQRADPAATVANNDLYRRHAFARYRPEGGGCGIDCAAFALANWRPEVAACSDRVRLGLIDTALDQSHPALGGASITTRTFRRLDRRASDTEHGTGVASVLVGRAESTMSGVIPQARILAADAFHRSGSGDAADAFDLVSALDWLIAEGATVINMSLSGPPNDVLEAAIAATLADGIGIVAAAGKASGAASGYPARYPGVTAVTGIDGRLRVLQSASRGAHISFAAPGAGISVAGPRRSIARVDGTSFAAPFVAAAMALHMSAGSDASTASDRVRSAAKDLGAPGRDPVFGWGLVQFRDLPRC